MRRIVKPMLLVVLAAGLGVIFLAFRSGGQERWSTVAGALAVIAAVVSGWTAQDVVDLERERQEPYPYPRIDAYSRYSLLQLRVTNSGGTVARNIRLRWDQPLLNTKGQAVRFTDKEGGVDIPVLPPGDDVAVLIGESHAFFENNADATYSGEIEFENAAGRRRRHRVHVSAEAFRASLTYDDEAPKTHYQLQKIPGQLKDIATAIGKLKSNA